MRYSLVIGLIFIWPMCLSADVFKTAEIDDNKPGMKAFQEALKNDLRGDYYRHGEDYPLASDLGGGNYHQNTDNGSGDISKQYGSFDLDRNIKAYLQNKGFDQTKINQMVDQSTGRTGDKNSLMLLEYSSPVEADLLKHFYTTALLKMSIRSQQYDQLNNRSQDELADLVMRSRFLCINDYLNTNANASIDQAFNSCRNKEVFSSLVGGTNVSDGIIKNSLSRVAMQGSKGAPIVDITGDVSLNKDNYAFNGPLKRAGDIFEEERQQYMDDIDSLVKEFISTLSVNQDSLDRLSVPGVYVGEYQVRNLALLPSTQQVMAEARLASHLAYMKTIQRYMEADEYLRRALESPRVDPVYKTFIENRRQFVKEEMVSLAGEKELIHDYAQESVSIVDQADHERFKTIKQMGE